MFSLITKKIAEEEGTPIYSVSLELTYHDLKLRFDPELTEVIREINTDADTGTINTRPSNGEFRLCWSPTEVLTECAKYGYGQGGMMQIAIKSTPVLAESLRTTLKFWKSIIQ